MFVMIFFPIFVASALMRLPFFPYILSLFSINFYYQNFILEVTIYLKNIFTAYDITFKFTKYYQPKQYENYQPRALAFSPSIQEQYIITIIITCLEENNGRRQ